MFSKFISKYNLLQDFQLSKQGGKPPNAQEVDYISPVIVPESKS